MTSNRTENADRPLSAIEVATAGIDVDELVREAQGGSEAAFNRLVSAFGGPVYNLAYRMTGNAADADELAQEVFVKLFRSIRKFRWRSKFSTWLYSLAANTCRSGLRKIRRIAWREVVHLDRQDEAGRSVREAPDHGERPGDAMVRDEARAQVESAIASLGKEFRVAIILRDLQGLAYDDIAEILGCSAGTVKSRISRARTQVRERLVRQGVVR